VRPLFFWECLEIQSEIPRKRSSSRRAGNPSETRAVDIRVRRTPVGMIQDVDCIHPELEILCLRDTDLFTQVHVETGGTI